MIMMPNFKTRRVETPRHQTSFLEAGPPDGRLLIFVHGWPSIGLLWRHQLTHFAAGGWRCVAPDMRGYGRSSVPGRIADYTVRHAVGDLIELQDALGAEPAVWVGHDWGCAPVWAMAAHHPERCAGVANLCVPHFARGFTLPNIIATVDRALYPADRYPVGQWDYWLYHREHAGAAAANLSADTRATVTALHQRATSDSVGKPAPFANVRTTGGFFGSSGRAPAIPRDDTMLSPEDLETMVAALERTGFHGANAWYLNDAANAGYAAEAPDFGRVHVPALFVHAEWDTVADTVHSALAAPMREDCTDLVETTIAAGHFVMLEQPDALNEELER